MRSDAPGDQIREGEEPGTGRWRFWPVDFLHLAFIALLGSTSLAFRERITHAPWWIAFDLAAVVALFAIARAQAAASPRRGVLLRLLHGVLVVPVVFTQVGFVIDGVRPVDYAPDLERLDRVLCLGANPLEILERVSHPLITEVMQWAYTSYLVLPVAFGLLLAAKGTRVEVSRSLFSLLGVMYGSYLGYMIVPAAGPNIHSNLGPLAPVGIAVLPLYEFTTDLPGVWMTAALRSWMFSVELTKKDCFPSGHVAVAIVCGVLAHRIDRRVGPAFLVLAAGVTASTIYLRYHYVVDVVAGALLAWFGLTAWLRVHDWLARGKGYDLSR